MEVRYRDTGVQADELGRKCMRTAFASLHRLFPWPSEEKDLAYRIYLDLELLKEICCLSLLVWHLLQPP